jgi:hypothetical protein
MKTRTCLLLAMLPLLGACAPAAATRKPVVECGFPTEGAPTGPALVSRVYGAMSPIPLNAVQFTDHDLAKQLVVQSLRSDRTATSTLQVSARLVNCLDRAQAVNARTSFLGLDDAPAEPDSGWQTVVLQPRSSAVYRQASTATDVQAFLVELRPDGYRGIYP